MKSLHRPDLFGWSSFDAARNVDFHGLAIVRRDGNVLVDPMPLSAHDRAHLEALGGAAWIVITNSDHCRAAAEIQAWTGARIAAPAGERDGWSGPPVDRFLADGDTLVPGIEVVALAGSKTPGELALVLGDTLVTGDLVRAHTAAGLMLLPPPKLADPAAAHESVRRLAALPGIETVLVGDGWHCFRDGGAQLRALAGRLLG